MLATSAQTVFILFMSALLLFITLSINALIELREIFLR